MTNYTKLIAALEAAEGPSRELDGEVALAVGWQHKASQDGKGVSGEPIIRHTWTSPTGEDFWQKTTIFNRADKFPDELPAYTESIDAALSFTPEGWEWWVRHNIAGDYTSQPGSWYMGQISEYMGKWRFEGISRATPAIALCIANLRALENAAD